MVEVADILECFQIESQDIPRMPNVSIKKEIRTHGLSSQEEKQRSVEILFVVVHRIVWLWSDVQDRQYNPWRMENGKWKALASALINYLYIWNACCQRRHIWHQALKWNFWLCSSISLAPPSSSLLQFYCWQGTKGMWRASKLLLNFLSSECLKFPFYVSAVHYGLLFLSLSLYYKQWVDHSYNYAII